MARQKPSTLGGQKLSDKIASFMKVNVEEIKKQPVKDADGIKDISDAIAFAVEEVMKQILTVKPVPDPTTGGMALVSTTGPVTGTISLSTQAYNFTLPGV